MGKWWGEGGWRVRSLGRMAAVFWVAHTVPLARPQNVANDRHSGRMCLWVCDCLSFLACYPWLMFSIKFPYNFHDMMNYLGPGTDPAPGLSSTFLSAVTDWTIVAPCACVYVSQFI